MFRSFVSDVVRLSHDNKIFKCILRWQPVTPLLLRIQMLKVTVGSYKGVILKLNTVAVKIHQTAPGTSEK